MGTNADFTTSMSSSSELSEFEWSTVECILISRCGLTLRVLDTGDSRRDISMGIGKGRMWKASMGELLVTSAVVKGEMRPFRVGKPGGWKEPVGLAPCAR